jgi:DMSO/TMAO reductase YedYZ molybdopterin-dependent catalytic subunit
MKNLILTMALLLSLTAVAQHGKRDHHHKRASDMTAEQLATLKTKKMALALDLTSKQQQEVLKVNLEEAEFRKAKMAERKENKEEGERERLSTDEKFEIQNAILDRKIAQQEKLKEILTDEQFNLWKKVRHRKGMHSKKKMQKASRRG